MLWGAVGFVPLFRLTYWDFLARRVAWRAWFDTRTEDEKRKDAESIKADWGYNPRYEPVYDFSIKKQKYALQSKEEKLNDHPLLSPGENKNEREGIWSGKDVRDFY